MAEKLMNAKLWGESRFLPPITPQRAIYKIKSGAVKGKKQGGKWYVSVDNQGIEIDGPAAQNDVDDLVNKVLM